MTYREVKPAIGQLLDGTITGAGDGTVYGAAVSAGTPWHNYMPYGVPLPNETVEYADGRKFIGCAVPVSSGATYDLPLEGMIVQLLGVDATLGKYPEIISVQDPAANTGTFIRVGVLMVPYVRAGYGNANSGNNRFVWVQVAGDCLAQADGSGTGIVLGDSLAVVKGGTNVGLLHNDAAGTYANEDLAFAEALQATTGAVGAANTTPASYPTSNLIKVRLRGAYTIQVAHT